MTYESEPQEVPEGFTHLGEDLGEKLADASPGLSVGHEKHIHYPELHFDGKHAEHLIKHLGKSGIAHIKYKKVSEHTETRTHGGKEHTSHRVGIQIHGIKPIKDAGGEKESAEALPKNEDAIDMGLEAAEKE